MTSWKKGGNPNISAFSTNIIRYGLNLAKSCCITILHLNNLSVEMSNWGLPMKTTRKQGSGAG